MGRQVARSELPFEYRFATAGAIKPGGILLDSATALTCLHDRMARSTVVGTTCLFPKHTGFPSLNRLTYATHGYHLPSVVIRAIGVLSLEGLVEIKKRVTQRRSTEGNSNKPRDPVILTYQAFNITVSKNPVKILSKINRQKSGDRSQ